MRRCGAFCFGLAGTLVLFAGCREPAVRENDESIPRVRVVEVRTQVVPQRISVFGTVAPLNSVDVHPTTEGRIEALFVEEGDRVNGGTPLGQLDTTHLEISRARALSDVAGKEALVRLAVQRLSEGRRTAEARLISISKMEWEVAQRRLESDSLKQSLDDQERLFEAGGVSEGEVAGLRTRHQRAVTALNQAETDLQVARIGFRESDLQREGLPVPDSLADRESLLIELNTGRLAAEVDVARSELEASRAELRRVELLLKESLILSPTTSVVGRRYVDVGEKCRPDTLLFTLFDARNVYAVVTVPERNAPRVRRGQTAQLLVGGSTTREGALSREGSVHLITPYVDTQSRSARVRILLENSDNTLLPGAFVRGWIEVGPALERLVLPRGAIRIEGSGTGDVMLIRDGLVFRRRVAVERSDGAVVGVLGGLAAGDVVVADASRFLKDGTRVDVSEVVE